MWSAPRNNMVEVFCMQSEPNNNTEAVFSVQGPCRDDIKFRVVQESSWRVQGREWSMSESIVKINDSAIIDYNCDEVLNKSNHQI
jgi:hypothetical protein